MAKKAPAPKSTELDGKEFFAALNLIEQEKGISKQFMLERIAKALIDAYKKDHEGIGDNVTVDFNEDTCEVKMYVKKDVVETVDNPQTEMSLEEAQASLPQAQLGDVLRIEIKTRNFGRIAAQNARQGIVQGMREAERGMIYDEFSAKEHEILTGVVTRIDPRSGSAYVRITSGGEFTDGSLSLNDQVPGEAVKEGDRIKVYVTEVNHAPRGPQVRLSRKDAGLVKRLFELEVPEIYDGTVEIRSAAREAGSRTKIAVWSSDPNVDPIGACVGTRGQRVNAIVEELHGEKIDIVKYSDDPLAFVAAALAPADVVSAKLLPDGKSCRVVVPDDQLSLAIGREGQNARLAARLTGMKIDIKPASAPEDEAEEAGEPEEAPEEVPEAGEAAGTEA